MDNKSRNTDFFITRASELLEQLESSTSDSERSDLLERIHAISITMSEPTAGFSDGAVKAIQAINDRAHQGMQKAQTSQMIH